MQEKEYCTGQTLEQQTTAVVHGDIEMSTLKQELCKERFEDEHLSAGSSSLGSSVSISEASQVDAYHRAESKRARAYAVGM